jgi:hypothetical protein
MAARKRAGSQSPTDDSPSYDVHNTDEAAVKNPTDMLTEQRQPKDAGPLSHERDVGQFSGRGRPPLQKK